MAEIVYPTAEGLEAATASLSALPAGRLAAHVPVLLGVESALAAGEVESVDVAGTQRDVVPNQAIRERLDRWFGVAGDADWPYFSPMTLPGGEYSLHWRNDGIISRNTMSAAERRRWVAKAVAVSAGGRGYPLLELDAWRAAVAQDLGDDDKYQRGIDLAALGAWLARSAGVEAQGPVPTRNELIAFAIAGLGISPKHDLLTSDPEVLSSEGDYEPAAAHFSSDPLDEEEIFAVASALDGGDPDAPVPEGDGSGDWLRERFEEWKAETGYPTTQDLVNQAAREAFANSLFAEEKLADGELDLTEFRRFAVQVYGGPGPQSHVMRFLRDHPETGPKELAATLRHLLYGDGEVADRLDDVLGDPEWRISGFGESLAVKALAVRYPEKWLPLFVYWSGVGAGKRDLMRVARLPALDEDDRSVGQLALSSNDVLRERVEPLLPDDPWGQSQFLWWLRSWVPTSSLAEELLVPAWWIEEVEALSEDKPQIIFYGPPGTGKTFIARRLAETWADPGNVRIVQFHPSYAYEDFVQGYRPVEDATTGEPRFKLSPGPLMALAEQARTTGERCVLIIDEINRGNIAKVFGELYFLLEYRDAEVEMQYGGRFSLPENLTVVGTMNTADRSIALLDAALRRRFHFVPFFPDEEPIDGLLKRWLEAHKPAMTWVADLVDEANELLDDRHLQIGPSHFMRENLNDEWLRRIWTYSIIPYVQEHFFDEPERVADFELDKLKAAVQGSSEGAGGSGAQGAVEANEPTATESSPVEDAATPDIAD